MGYGLWSSTKRLVRPLVGRVAIEPVSPDVASILSAYRHASDAEIALLDALMEAAPDPRDSGKSVVQFVSASPEKGAYIGASEVYLARFPVSRAALLIFIAENYVAGRNPSHCVEAAHRLLARCLEQARGAVEELAVCANAGLFSPASQFGHSYSVRRRRLRAQFHRVLLVVGR